MGRVTDYMAQDHADLDALLDRAVADFAQPDLTAFDEFRAGLLRHIAIEEKVLLVEAKQLRGGQPLPATAQLRLDHAAIAGILAVAPVPDLIAELRALLAAHNPLEEGSDGVYAQCERLAGDGADALLARIQAVPSVPVAPFAPLAKVRGVIARALARADEARRAR